MRVLSVVGTRPNFVKEALVNRECRAGGIQVVLVHASQHYDYKMSELFFEALEVPRPDYHFPPFQEACGERRTSWGSQGSWSSI